MSSVLRSMLVSNAISASGSASTGNVYTAPADSYAIVQLMSQTPNTANFTVDGQIVPLFTTGISTYAGAQGIYIGPGQTLAITFSGTVDWFVSGVEFTIGS